MWNPISFLFSNILNLDGDYIPFLPPTSWVCHIEAKTKLLSFSRQHFQMHYFEWKWRNFAEDFTEICSQGLNQQYSRIGSDNGLAPTSYFLHQWWLVYWHIYASLGLNELISSLDQACLKLLDDWYPENYFNRAIKPWPTNPKQLYLSLANFCPPKILLS